MNVHYKTCAVCRKEEDMDPDVKVTHDSYTRLYYCQHCRCDLHSIERFIVFSVTDDDEIVMYNKDEGEFNIISDFNSLSECGWYIEEIYIGDADSLICCKLRYRSRIRCKSVNQDEIGYNAKSCTNACDMSKAVFSSISNSKVRTFINLIRGRL